MPRATLLQCARRLPRSRAPASSPKEDTMSIRKPIAALAAAIVLAATGIARSQEPPKPSPEIQRITALAGTFDGEASYTVGGKTTKFTLHHVNKVIAGGFGLAAHEEADVPGMGHYEAENLFGWDPGRQMLHLFSVTSDPNTHDHAGKWTDAHHATLRYEGLRDGKKLVEVIPMEVVNADEYRFKSTLTVAGGSPEVFEATMKRTGALSSK